ncbi:MAG: 30S ribosomal protein S20, partial [Candidatus Dormibacteria bacterium]
LGAGVPGDDCYNPGSRRTLGACFAALRAANPTSGERRVANIKSAKKRVLVSARKHEQNGAVRSAVKTRIVRVRRLVEAGEAQPLEELKLAVSGLDKAAEHGVLHPNNAARRKSRLMRQVARAAALAADPEAAAKAAADARAHAKGSGKSTAKGKKSAKVAAAKVAAAKTATRTRAVGKK